MDLHFSFKEMRTSNAIREYARQKSEQLEKFFQGRISVNWIFNAGHKKQLKVAHCQVRGDHMNYFGQAETEDIFGSIDLVADRMERQLRKHKEIVKDHLHRPGHRASRNARALAPRENTQEKRRRAA